MKKVISFAVVSLVSFIAFPTSVVAASSSDEDYQEFSYDDLVNQLHSKTKKTVTNSYSAFDDVRIHASIGYINSFADIETSNGSIRRHQNGLQLAMGMDLFSPNWFSEACFKNFGLTTGPKDEVSLKAIELKIGYQNQVQGPWSYSLASGLSNRFLKYKNFSTGETLESTTPSMLISMGVSAEVSKALSFGIDLTGKSPIVNETHDRGSYDFTIKMNAYL